MDYQEAVDRKREETRVKLEEYILGALREKGRQIVDELRAMIWRGGFAESYVATERQASDMGWPPAFIEAMKQGEMDAVATAVREMCWAICEQFPDSRHARRPSGDRPKVHETSR